MYSCIHSFIHSFRFGTDDEEEKGKITDGRMSFPVIFNKFCILVEIAIVTKAVFVLDKFTFNVFSFQLFFTLKKCRC